MSGKDIHGLIEFLRRNREHVRNLKKVYEDSEYKSSEERIAELGMELSEYNYYLRVLEEGEWTLR